jgi:predicted nucleotidyltransferase
MNLLNQLHQPIKTTTHLINLIQPNQLKYYICIEMQLSANDIQIVKDYFSGQPVIKAYLFGSYSRGEADNNSDVDILVDLDYSKHIGLGFVTMQSELQQKLKKKIDLISSKALSKYIKPFVEKEKVLIYER